MTNPKAARRRRSCGRMSRSPGPRRSSVRAWNLRVPRRGRSRRRFRITPGAASAPAPAKSPLTTTMPGLAAPPPIPSPGSPPPAANKTIMGLAKPPIPQVKPKSPSRPSCRRRCVRSPGLPSVPPGARPLSGPIPTMRQTQPGAGTPPSTPSCEHSLVEYPARARRARQWGHAHRRAGRARRFRPAALEVDRPDAGARCAGPATVESGSGARRIGRRDRARSRRCGRWVRRLDRRADPARRIQPPEADFSDLSDPLRRCPAPHVAVKRDTLGDNPPTAEHEVSPEVHARGGLKPFVAPSFAASEPTNTSPSIEIIREPSTGEIEPLRAKRPSNLPTSEMSPAQVQELKRATIGDDPLVELAIEAHTIGTIDVHEGNEVNLAARGTNASAAANPTRKRGRRRSRTRARRCSALGRAGDQPPARSRMPSPTPPSLAPPGMTPPDVRVRSAPHL